MTTTPSTLQALDRHEQIAAGKALRQATPRSAHENWQPAPDRPDPIALLQTQDVGRLPHLVPIRYGRMAESPFAFLRGSAVVMAADLASTPTTGLDVMLCGDAHLSNFGLFASPERALVFDINDFDESFPGPWEWDLMRLATSAVVAGRANGFNTKATERLARTAVAAYRRALASFAKMTYLDVWYFHVSSREVETLLKQYGGDKAGEEMTRVVHQARGKTQANTVAQMTTVVNGHHRFKSQPPLLVPADQWEALDLYAADQEAQLTAETIEASWLSYMNTLPVERQYLLNRYRMTDVALRVGGVGSVGTRCFAIVLQGQDPDDAIILQTKEAGASVLESYVSRTALTGPAERVVTAQRLLQATSDIFLGWNQSSVSDRNYYWRQLKDMKGSVKPERLGKRGLRSYVATCGVCLARAHARTGYAQILASYAGRGRTLDNALADFAHRYADQTEQDHAALLSAIESGRVQAEYGV